MAWRDIKKSAPPPPKKVTPPKKQKTEEPAEEVHIEEARKKSPGVISWEAPEFIYYEKTPDWYWSLGIITVALLVIAFLGQNFLFGVLVLLSAFTIVLYATKRPRIIRITASADGIVIDTKEFPLEGLKSFWIFYRVGGIKELSILSEKRLMPHIKIPLGDANPNEIRDFLLQYMYEKRQEESLIDLIANRLKF